jgi:hypothetical protein
LPNATESLIPEVTTLLVNDPRVPTDVINPPKPHLQASGFLGSYLPDVRTFGSIPWRVHRRLWGCRWDKAGVLEGRPLVEYRGGADYAYRPDPAQPFRFTRANGHIIEPGTMVTDGASVPRVLWAVPGLSAMDYLPAALIHDWIFTDHHCNPTSFWSFEEANDVLGEVMYTMMTAARPPFRVPEDWGVIVAYHTAVNSVIGRRIWSREWTDAEKMAALNP